MGNSTASLNDMFKEAYGSKLDELLGIVHSVNNYVLTSHFETTDTLFRWYGIKFTKKRKEKMAKVYYN